jgi:hypothetical protein
MNFLNFFEIKPYSIMFIQQTLNFEGMSLATSVSKKRERETVEEVVDSSERSASLKRVARDMEESENTYQESWIFQLPEHLLYECVFALLDLKDLVNVFRYSIYLDRLVLKFVYRVCKRWKKAQEDDYFWKQFVMKHYPSHFAQKEQTVGWKPYQKPPDKVIFMDGLCTQPLGSCTTDSGRYEGYFLLLMSVCMYSARCALL